MKIAHSNSRFFLKPYFFCSKFIQLIAEIPIRSFKVPIRVSLGPPIEESCRY